MEDEVAARHQRRLDDQQREPAEHRGAVQMHPERCAQRVDEPARRELRETEDNENGKADRHPLPEPFGVRRARNCRHDPHLPMRPGACLLQRSEEHTSELQSLMRNSYAVFCLKKQTKKTTDYSTKYRQH